MARSINEMARQLARRMAEERQNEQARYELITSLSHDLKSPLTSILGYLDLLQTPSGLTGDTPQHYVATAHRKALLLNSRINRLFEYSQLSTLSERGLLQMVPTLLRQLAGDFVPLFERRGITVELTCTPATVLLPIDHHY
ncbi:sensor histidine kinase [Hymenobacter perfusus]|uniref:histidine kinase n=1 Tax=Hymenobacter perfusus TaxID=1236770 RepID=A0A428JZK9_9BACT|nr:histidine kinase dimerization/phospho-acceptor domain-containing protein [Hymenobacter perfusus]RSK39543.1 sensor histidine kinase [Hymenobacter perfusus]